VGLQGARRLVACRHQPPGGRVGRKDVLELVPQAALAQVASAMTVKAHGVRSVYAREGVLSAGCKSLSELATTP